MKPALAAASLLFATGMLASASVFTIEDLGSLGGLRATGASINNQGQVAGYGTDALGNFVPFDSTFTVMTPPGADGASLYGINGNALVVGNVYYAGHSQATVWVDGAAQALGGLGGADSYATGINASGQISGMATTAHGAGRAVIYSGGGGIADVSLPGAYYAAANGINDHGAIAGSAMNGSMQYQAYTWSSADGYQVLGTLGGMNSYALAINNSGWVAGHSQTGSGYLHAFLWNGSGMLDLGTLGGTSSYAYAVNGAGMVVGHSYTSGGAQRAFLYVNGVLFDLNSLVANLGGWVLTEAYGINDSGQITGTGIIGGVERVFRLSPFAAQAAADVPEPGSVWLAAGGLAAVLFRRVRNRLT